MDETENNNNNSNNDKAMSTSNYNFEDGRLQASIRWLITRIYSDQNQMPDTLCEPFKLNIEDRLELTQPVIFCLTNGSFYCQAAAKIFHDPSFLNGDLGLLFYSLNNAGIDVKDIDGQPFNIELLKSQLPFNMNAHLSFIDSLMVAHLRSIISIDRVVQAISNYAVIEKREEPLDCVDALLFWINKVCLIVRDDVERNSIALSNGRNCIDEQTINNTTIPEMEDLYEDLCDGTCICTLVSFYRPDELPLKEICFKEPMSVNDCKFNLELLRNFCATNLPWNPFHFRIDDILFLHESLQPNVNAFLTDLFIFFEGQQLTDSEIVPIQQTVQRNFLRTQQPFDQQQQQETDPLMLENMQNRRNKAFSTAMDDIFFGGTGSLPRSRNLSVASPHQLRLNKNILSANSGTSTMQHFPITLTQDKMISGFNPQLETWRNQFAGNQQQQNTFSQFQGIQRSNTLNRPSKDENPTPRPQSVLMQSQQWNVTGSHQTLVPDFDQLTNQMNNLKFTSPEQRQQFHPELLQQQQRQQTNVFGANMFPSLQSTPQQNLPPKHFVSLQQQDISPIGPPPPDSIIYSDYSFVEQPNTLQHIQGQQIPQSIKINSQFFPEQQQIFQQNFPSGCPQSNYISSTNSSNLYSTPLQNFNSGYGGQQQHQNSIYYTPTSYHQNLGYIGGGGGGQLQQSLSQPSHLHLLHQQQQQIPQLSHSIHSQFGQKQTATPQFQYQSQQVDENQPYNNNSINMPQQQQYTPIPSLPFNQPTGSTCFPVSDPYSLTHLHNYQQQMQQCIPSNQQQQQFDQNIQFNKLQQQTNLPSNNNIEPDPENDLRKELANWGGTYRLTEKPQRKTWASKKVEMQQRIIASNPVAALNAALHNSRSTSALTSNVKDQNDSTSTPKNDSNGCSTLSSDEKTVNQNISISLDVSDSDNSEMTPEMLAKRQALLSSQLRRKERIVAKSEEKELASLEKRQSEMQKLELAEQRKLEREQRRLKCLEEYKRKKLEQELGEQPGGSARICSSSTMSLNNRGQSQPPFRRPKSQTNLNINQTRTLQRPYRAQSSVNNDDNDENVGISSSRSNVPASVLGEPSLKLYARQQPKSNRTLILNALQYSIFPGHVSNDNRQKVQNSIASSDSKHFLVLFRDHRLQYRGLYTWDQFSEAVHKIEGTGPKVCREPMMTIMYKYDSGAKSFGKIPTKHLSATIDGFVIAEQYWQRPKIPFSGR